MSGKKRAASKVTTTKEPVVVAQESVKEKEAVAESQVTYPCSVLLKNNTHRRVTGSVTGGAVLMPHSENTVEVKSEGDLKQIINNFEQLNQLNKWTNGLQVIHPLGDDDA